MDAAAELERNPVSKHQIQPEYAEMSRLTRDGTAEPVSQDQIFRHARGQGNIIFPCSADREQDWQPYPVDPYSAICDDHTYIPYNQPNSFDKAEQASDTLEALVGRKREMMKPKYTWTSWYGAFRVIKVPLLRPSASNMSPE